MAYQILPYNNEFTAEFNRNLEPKPPRGIVIRRDVPILESKAKNEQRRADRAAAGLTNDFKLQTRNDVEIDGAAGSCRYYQEQLGDVDLTWDEF
jgi:hypothetical protein